MSSTMCKICLKDIKEDKRGLSMLGVHICTDCLASILSTKTDSIKYEDYKIAFRDIWIDYIALNY